MVLQWEEDGQAPSPLCTHFVKDSEFRAFIIPSDQRSSLAATLRQPFYSVAAGHEATPHHSALLPGCPGGTPCVHVPAAGGGGLPVDDGEPLRARVGETLADCLGEAPECTSLALVVWRRFGGSFLGVSSGALTGAYRHVAQEALARHRLLTSPPWRAFLSQKDGCYEKPAGKVEAKATIAPLDHLVLPLPIPCAYVDQAFLTGAEADSFLQALAEGANWEFPEPGSREERGIAFYGDQEYTSRDGKGYLTTTSIPWARAPPEVTELKRRAEAWHLRVCGLPVVYDVCLLNRYDSGRNCLAWHADREEIDPMNTGPRASPIASISLGAERLFGFAPKWNDALAREVRALAEDFAAPAAETRAAAESRLQTMSLAPVRLKHGSLCVMENVCQLLYKHSLLPEYDAEGMRVNVTFRSKRPTALAIHPPPLPISITSEGKAGENIFVGLAPGVDHRCGVGWKAQVFHPFESPFVEESPAVAVACYQTWLQAQPVFARYVLDRLRGKSLSAASSSCSSTSSRDALHARLLCRLAGASMQELDEPERRRLAPASRL